MRARQEADGGWGGIQPPWVWSILMLASLGHGFEDEQLRAAVEGWGGFLVDEGDRLRPEACQSPDLGHGARPPRSPCLRRLCRPSAARQGRRVAARRGDPGPRRLVGARARRRAGGGWAFEFANDLYPDVDDVAVICLALRELGMGEDAVARGLAWMEGMQSLERRLGRVRRRQHERVDLPDPVLRLRGRDRPAERGRRRPCGRGARAARAYADATRRGLDYLLREQQDDGSWWGRWGVNHVYGTAAVLPALEACGLDGDHPAFRRAVAWLDSVQARETAASARTSAPTTSASGVAAACPHLHKRRGAY